MEIKLTKTLEIINNPTQGQHYDYWFQAIFRALVSELEEKTR